MNASTIAEQIVSTSSDATDAMIAADKICAGEQDWNNASTTWTFDDGSKLFVSEMDFTALPGIHEIEGIVSHLNAAGEIYYSTEQDGETVYSFTDDFDDTWSQEDEDAIAAGSTPSKI